MGSAVLEFMSEHNYQANLVRMGIPDSFVEHGSQEELYKECGYDINGIYNTVKSLNTSI